MTEDEAIQFLNSYRTGMPYETETKFGWRLVFKGLSPVAPDMAAKLLEHEAAFRRRGYTLIETDGAWILTLWVRLDYISGPKSIPSAKFHAEAGKTDSGN